MEFNLRIEFEKSAAPPTGEYVRGWASVIEKDGAQVVDHEGHTIEMHELTQAAHQFVTDSREGHVYHGGERVGSVVESVLVDEPFAKALGVTDTRRGWWVGMQIHDDAIRARIASGELRAFSIGGSAVLEEVGQ